MATVLKSKAQPNAIATKCQLTLTFDSNLVGDSLPS